MRPTLHSGGRVEPDQLGAVVNHEQTLRRRRAGGASRSWEACRSRERPRNSPPSEGRTGRSSGGRARARRGRRRPPRESEAIRASVRSGNSALRRPPSVSRTRIAFGFKTWSTICCGPIKASGLSLPGTRRERPVDRARCRRRGPAVREFPPPSRARSSLGNRTSDCRRSEIRASGPRRGPRDWHPPRAWRRGWPPPSPWGAPPRSWIHSIVPFSRLSATSRVVGGRDDLVGQVADPDRFPIEVGRPERGPRVGVDRGELGPSDQEDPIGDRPRGARHRR